MPIPGLTEKERLRAEELLAVFEEQDAEGNYLAEDADVRHMLPALALLSGWEPDELGDDTPLARLMHDFGAQLGLSPDDPLKSWEATAAAFYKRYPPHAALIAKLKAALGSKPKK